MFSHASQNDEGNRTACQRGAAAVARERGDKLRAEGEMLPVHTDTERICPRSGRDLCAAMASP